MNALLSVHQIGYAPNRWRCTVTRGNKIEASVVINFGYGNPQTPAMVKQEFKNRFSLKLRQQGILL